jgi:hypothetical protein
MVLLALKELEAPMELLARSALGEILDHKALAVIWGYLDLSAPLESKVLTA